MHVRVFIVSMAKKYKHKKSTMRHESGSPAEITFLLFFFFFNLKLNGIKALFFAFLLFLSMTDNFSFGVFLSVSFAATVDQVTFDRLAITIHLSEYRNRF